MLVPGPATAVPTRSMRHLFDGRRKWLLLSAMHYDRSWPRLCNNSIAVRFRGYQNPSRPRNNRIQRVLRGRRSRHGVSRGVFTQPRPVSDIRTVARTPEMAGYGRYGPGGCHTATLAGFRYGEARFRCLNSPRQHFAALVHEWPVVLSRRSSIRRSSPRTDSPVSIIPAAPVIPVRTALGYRITAATPRGLRSCASETPAACSAPCSSSCSRNSPGAVVADRTRPTGDERHFCAPLEARHERARDRERCDCAERELRAPVGRVDIVKTVLDEHAGVLNEEIDLVAGESRGRSRSRSGIDRSRLRHARRGRRARATRVGKPRPRSFRAPRAAA